MQLDSDLNIVIDANHLRNTYVNGLDIANIEYDKIVIVWGEMPNKIYAQILNYKLEPVIDEKIISIGKKPFVSILSNGNIAVSSIHGDHDKI